MRRRNRKSRIDEYPSSQAKQLLGDAFERQRPPKKEMRAWVPTEKRGDAMRIVANEVINQKGVSPDRAIEALGLMQEEYVRFLPTLEGSDRAHSTSSERTVFVEDMAELFRGAGRG
jgi:hypothetical protein